MGVTMRTALCLFFVCFLGSCFAAHVQSSGLAWQGTWTEEKRGFGGNLYICVDRDENVAYGTYSGVGLISGSLKGTQFIGEWYEAGYDRPFGSFSLTLSGTSSQVAGVIIMVLDLLKDLFHGLVPVLTMLVLQKINVLSLQLAHQHQVLLLA